MEPSRGTLVRRDLSETTGGAVKRVWWSPVEVDPDGNADVEVVVGD